MKRVLCYVVMLSAILAMMPQMQAEAQSVCSPGRHQLTVFTGYDFTGRCVVYDIKTIKNVGKGINDQIRSVLLGKDTFAVACVDKNFYGDCEEFYKSRNVNLVDRITSIVVQQWECIPNSGEITLFSDVMFGGVCAKFYASGTANDPYYYSDLSTPLNTGSYNDVASSLMVNHAEVILCEHRNFGGVCEKHVASAWDLTNYAIGNDRVSSLQVFAH
ncbi:MAG: hypothetical protein R3E39_08000 [Anaerolineae bacterium]